MSIRKQRCGNCTWFDAKVTRPGSDDDGNGGAGTCQRYPPRRSYDKMPATHWDNWCGEWREASEDSYETF